MRVMCLLVLLAACSPTTTGEPTPDAGSAQAPAVGTVESFATLPTSTEGIAFGADALFASGGGHVYRIAPDGSVVTHAEVPGGLGMALLPGGDLVVCGKDPAQSGELTGVLWRVSPSGAASILVGAGMLKVPNMIAVAPDGSIVFSDSAGDAVWRVDADGSDLSVVTRDITYPNGIAFAQDGSKVFVASWDSERVYTMAFSSDGTYGAPERYLDAAPTVDGISVLAGGDLVFVSTGMGVVRVDAAKSITTIAPADQFSIAANGASGVGAFDGRWLYVTDLFRSEIARVYIGRAGITLPVTR